MATARCVAREIVVNVNEQKYRYRSIVEGHLYTSRSVVVKSSTLPLARTETRSEAFRGRRLVCQEVLINMCPAEVYTA